MLTSDSESGRMGLRGKERPETLIPPPWHGRQGGFSGEMAVRCAPWASFQGRDYGFPHPSQGEMTEKSAWKRNFSGTGSPNSVEVGHQDAAVAQIDLTGIGRGLVPVVGESSGLLPEVRRFVIGHPFLDRTSRRDGRLEGVDVERRLWWRWDANDTLPKVPRGGGRIRPARAAARLRWFSWACCSGGRERGRHPRLGG